MGNQKIGGVKLVVEYNIQSLAQPGQLKVNELTLALNPNIGLGRNTATGAELELEPQALTEDTS